MNQVKTKLLLELLLQGFDCCWFGNSNSI